MTDMLKAKLDRELKKRSGDVTCDNPLVDFLYDLMRDHLSAGTVEGIMYEMELARHKTSTFTNGFLANYAKDLAHRLAPETEVGSVSEFESRVRNAAQAAKERIHEYPDKEKDTLIMLGEGLLHIFEDTPR